MAYANSRERNVIYGQKLWQQMNNAQTFASLGRQPYPIHGITAEAEGLYQVEGFSKCEKCHEETIDLGGDRRLCKNCLVVIKKFGEGETRSFYVIAEGDATVEILRAKLEKECNSEW